MASHRWLRMAMHAAWIAAVAALGFALSTSLQQAQALGLPTITLPGIATVTLPSLPSPTAPTTTAAAATTAATPAAPQSNAPAPATTTAPATPAATTSAVPDATADVPVAVVAGVVRLSGGVESIPVSSVRPPARLRILLSFAPKTIVRGTQPVAVKARIVDTRGYVIRGARVLISAGRAGALRSAGTHLSAKDGLVSFLVRNRVALGRASSLVLLVEAFDPVAPRTTATSRRVRVAVRGRR